MPLSVTGRVENRRYVECSLADGSHGLIGADCGTIFDVIKKVNGQEVASAGDLARLYTQFATLSMVQAEVQRGNATVVLSYSIQP